MWNKVRSYNLKLMFFLNDEYGDLHKRSLKRRVLSLIMQADTVRNVNEDSLLPLLLWGNAPKVKIFLKSGSEFAL